MSYLSGVFLLALPLAVVPVALHFYRRRQRRVVAWGAMQFLSAAMRSGHRRERIDEVVLMLLRCGMLLALVLALARPLLHSTTPANPQAREVILVLDNSLSMSRKIDGRTPMAALRQRAHLIVDELSPGDRVQVMLAVGGPDWQLSEPLSAGGPLQRKLHEIIDGLQVTLGAADMLSAVQAAVDAEADIEPDTSREVIVLTDGQRHGWQLEATGSWNQVRSGLQKRSGPTTIRIEAFGATDDPTNNLAIMGLDATHTQLSPQQTTTIRIHVRNLSDRAVDSTTLTQLVNDSEWGHLTIPPLAAGESHTVSWNWTAREPGVFVLEGRLDTEDQIAGDNVDTLIVEVVDRLPVLIVEPAAGYRRALPEAHFLTAALGYDRETPHRQWHSPFAPVVVTPEEFDHVTLNDYRVVVIANLTPLVGETLDRIRRFVERGGGVWVSLGTQLDRKNFNTLWYDEGDGLCPLPLGARRKNDGVEFPVEFIHPPAADHPATIHLSDTNRLDIIDTTIRVRHAFETAAGRDELSTLLQTSGGAPLAVERFLGRGRVIVQAIPFDTEWSNLPLTRAFVVMVSDWLRYLAAPSATAFNLQPGAVIDVSAARLAERSLSTLQLPDGTTGVMSESGPLDDLRYEYTATFIPGRYTVRFTNGEGNKSRLPFWVRRESEESQLLPLTVADRAKLKQSGLSFPGDAAPLLQKSNRRPIEHPAWNWLLASALALLVAEAAMAAFVARSRVPGRQDRERDVSASRWESSRGLRRRPAPPGRDV